MPCNKCAVSAEVDGKMQYVAVFLSDMKKVGQSAKRSGVLYQCQECGAFWEALAYQRDATCLSPEDVLQLYPGGFEGVSQANK